MLECVDAVVRRFEVVTFLAQQLLNVFVLVELKNTPSQVVAMPTCTGPAYRVCVRPMVLLRSLAQLLELALMCSTHPVLVLVQGLRGGGQVGFESSSQPLRPYVVTVDALTQ